MVCHDLDDGIALRWQQKQRPKMLHTYREPLEEQRALSRISAVHSQVRPLQSVQNLPALSCASCERVFDTQQALRVHTVRAHGSIPLYKAVLSNQCPWCTFTFVFVKHVKAHLRTRLHRGSCPVRATSSPYPLEQIEDICCPLGDETFSDLQLYNSHTISQETIATCAHP
jgi:hypothetical protein